MASRLKSMEAAVFARLRRRPPETRVGRTGLWLLVASLALVAIDHGAFHGRAFGPLPALLMAAAFVCGVILVYRWIAVRLLWKVRNRLIVTYLLMGFAPLALFGTLAAIAAYVFCGQFATYSATSELESEVMRLNGRNHSISEHLSHIFDTAPRDRAVSLPELQDMPPLGAQGQEPGLAAFVDGAPIRILNARVPLGASLPPAWISGDFHGLVLDGHRLYLRAVTIGRVRGHTITVFSSSPVTAASLADFGRGIGSIKIIPDIAEPAIREARRREHEAGQDDVAADLPPIQASDVGEVSGGTLPGPAHFYDARVFFSAPLAAVDWKTGRQLTGLLSVTSRPTLLYSRLFRTALQLGDFIRDALISIAALFGLIELVAFGMAVRLSNTITKSVADLYHATTELDRGHFGHRIQVRRRDQLAALSTSFNSMAASLERLLAEQREKDRLQNELAIAQEVQNNLFPRGDLRLPSLELHGVCQPARSVSGDYYDFLLVGAGELCLALGDISGKGISAALLMASLHSAVRAYRFAGEELGAERAFGVDASPLSSPGKMLGLLNRHLYRSTQPEKYATLFLAYYAGDSRKLTYSNGGQLPPLVLCADGSTKRLDCGGTVVGLIDGMIYDQATVSLDPGDILVAYSDGVTEPENEYGEFGEERLLAVIRRNRHLPLAAISAHALKELRAWIGDQEQPDDITLVLARQM
jgi:sigma-B regulation protein RsbU (phosphoserine phosphatase)